MPNPQMPKGNMKPMTDEELSEVLPKKKVWGDLMPHVNSKFIENIAKNKNAEYLGYNQAIDDCNTALKKLADKFYILLKIENLK